MTPDTARALVATRAAPWWEVWAVVPGANGQGLTLMRRARCTSADLKRAEKWHHRQQQRQQASRPRPFTSTAKTR